MILKEIIIMENMRITKWLHPSEKLWLLEEAIRIEKKTGDACRIETKRRI